MPEVGALSFEVARSRIGRVVTVSEESIARAILRIAEGEKGVVEGAGATPLAAFMEGKLKHLEGKKVVLVLCGGNIDPTTLSRCRTMISCCRLRCRRLSASNLTLPSTSKRGT